MKYIYIAGPYMDSQGLHDYRGYSEIDRHIAQARDAFVMLAKAGVGAFCPHLHSAHFEVIAPTVPPAYWYELDMHFLDSCDALLLLPGWQKSTGSLREKTRMEFELHRPVFVDVQPAILWAINGPMTEMPEVIYPVETAVEEQGPGMLVAPSEKPDPVCFCAANIHPHTPHLRGYSPFDKPSEDNEYVIHLKSYVVRPDGERSWLE